MATRKQAAEKIAQHPKVASADWIEVMYAVSLKPGWRDSGITTGEHVITGNTVKEVMEAVRLAEPCSCEQCLSGQGQRELN